MELVEVILVVVHKVTIPVMQRKLRWVKLHQNKREPWEQH